MSNTDAKNIRAIKVNRLAELREQMAAQTELFRKTKNLLVNSCMPEVLSNFTALDHKEIVAQSLKLQEIITAGRTLRDSIRELEDELGV